MLVAGGIPPPLAPPCAKPSVSRTPLSDVNTFPLLSIQVSKICSSVYPLPIPVLTPSGRRSGFCLFAQNKNRNGETVVLDSTEGFGEEEEEDDDGEGYDVENEYFEDDDLDVIVPIEELDDWLERKPRGFGEGKVYDTSIEDELLEEIEHSRKLQLANITKLKSLSLEPQKQLDKDAEAVSTGVCVRISHLPKKRNVHRDLKAAFKGISGVANIMPVVFGNKKTKDPICKGLAFVSFNSLEDAKRFIDIISIQNITFGKIDKRIKCEIVDSTNDALHKTLNSPIVGGESKASSVDESGLLILDGSEKSWDTVSGDEDDDIRESAKSLSASKLDDADRMEQKMKSSVVSLPSKRRGIAHASVQVKSAEKKEKKNTTAKIPGAAKRLKLREKAMLADVFSRYGSGLTSAAKER